MVSILIDNDLLLRTFQTDDAQELFRAVNHSRQHLRLWLDWVDKTTKPEHSLQFIQQSLQEQNNQSGLALGIFYKQQIIGGIGMHHWNHTTRNAQLGYWISKDYVRKGYINKCLSRFIDFLFEKTGLNKVEIHFVVSNTASAGVAKRLGFKTEGILRQSTVRNAVLEDMVVAGLLKGEWVSALPCP